MLAYYAIFVIFLVCLTQQKKDDLGTKSKATGWWGWPEPGNQVNPLQPGLSNAECQRRIYRDCNYPKTFSEEEVENARQYLNYAFTQLADIKPDKPLCPKLRVRHDWKCITNGQKRRLINAWKQLYAQGVVQNLTDLHVRYWSPWHKTVEAFSAHRFLQKEFDNYLLAIDPTVPLVYWDPYTYATHPELSSVWDVLGHSGNYSTGWCVRDGIYFDWGLKRPCVKRQWSPRGTICPWVTQEFVTNMIQTSTDFGTFALALQGLHFQPHVCIGGYSGQFSVPTAPTDVLFYMSHWAVTDNHLLKWQLLEQEFLTPLSYSGNFRYNPITGNVESTDITTDTITGFPSVRVVELFWIGFGDYCSLSDQFIKPLSKLWLNQSTPDPIPTAIRRLPAKLLLQYFPYFLEGNYTSLSHTLEEVGDCNTQCLPLVKPTFMKETEAGRRQFEVFNYDGGEYDQAPFSVIEQQYYQMWLDLNAAGYCSPYVTD